MLRTCRFEAALPLRRHDEVGERRFLKLKSCRPAALVGVFDAKHAFISVLVWLVLSVLPRSQECPCLFFSRVDGRPPALVAFVHHNPGRANVEGPKKEIEGRRLFPSATTLSGVFAFSRR